MPDGEGQGRNGARLKITAVKNALIKPFTSKLRGKEREQTFTPVRYRLLVLAIIFRSQRVNSNH